METQTSMASNNMYVHLQEEPADVLQEEPADVLQEEPADVAKKDTGDTVDVAMDNINRFLGQLGLVAKQVPGDNNCGYHAIAVQVLHSFSTCTQFSDGHLQVKQYYYDTFEDGNPEIVKSDMDTAARATRKVIRSTLSNDSNNSTAGGLRLARDQR